MSFGDGIDWGAEARRAAAESEAGASPGELLANVQEALGPQIGRIRLVDCGCNIGSYCPQFTGVGFEYVGIDQSAEALSIARKRHLGASFVESFLWDDWPARLGAFDAAVCNAVLQHNTHAEKERILLRIAQAVRQGGFFAMQESTVPTPTATQLTHPRWIQLVERRGFKLLKTWHKNEFGLEDGYLFKRGA